MILTVPAIEGGGTMKVKMLVRIPFPPGKDAKLRTVGEVVDCDSTDGMAVVDSGFAEEVKVVFVPPRPSPSSTSSARKKK